MGTAGSVNNKPRSPYHRLCDKKLRMARAMRCNNGEPSDFYSFCLNGDIDRVREMLEAPEHKPIEEFVKIEPNGNTALHIATEKGHIEIVRLLLEHRCPRTILNRSSKLAVEEGTTLEMQKLFVRSGAAARFHDTDMNKSMVFHLPEINVTKSTTNETKTTATNLPGKKRVSSTINEIKTIANDLPERDKACSTTNEIDLPETRSASSITTETESIKKEPINFVKRFKSEEDVYEYSLNQQTTAMWLRFYNWFSRTFPSLFQRENLHIESFDLHNNTDFKQFLSKKLSEPNCKETLDAIRNAQSKNSINPLITIYTNEATGFYKSLNKQLADSPDEADDSPHLCDRFIIEFHIRGDELTDRIFIGTTYRGATITSEDLILYEQALENKPRGVISFKAFTSTSESKDEALKFVSADEPQIDRTPVLFVMEIKTKSPTIIGISDISDYTNEQEVLIMPGNLFVVKKINKNVLCKTNEEQNVTLIEVHLEYLHIPMSFWTKLRHTVRSAKNSVM